MIKNNAIITKNILIILFSLGLAACSSGEYRKKITTKNWIEANQQVLKQYSPSADRRLRRAFSNVGLSYPPKQIKLIALKHERTMELWAKNKTNQWKFVKNYPFTATSGGPGPKLKEHDHQIPEGEYRIAHLNPFSSYHLSMMLNYPNARDKANAKKDGRTNLGGDIFIHGRSSSAGCISIGDAAVSELYVLVSRVGKHNAKVLIAPNDLRRGNPVTKMLTQPSWVRPLYSDLQKRMRVFTA